MALHVQRAHHQVLLWKAADKPDPPSVNITDYGCEVSENDHVMPVIIKSRVAPGDIMDVISCSCCAVGRACSKKVVAQQMFYRVPATQPTVYVKAVVIVLIPQHNLNLLMSMGDMRK